MPMFRLRVRRHATRSAGVPVVVNDLASTITGSIAGLLRAALVVMARGAAARVPQPAAAVAARRSRWRRPGSRSGWCRWSAASLTMASIAVLPILIGLAVDYAIQFQSRAEERARRRRVRRRPRRRRRSRPPRSPPRPASSCCCCRRCRWSAGSAMLLVVGIAVALACAFTAGSAAMVARRRAGGRSGRRVRGAGALSRGCGRRRAGGRSARRRAKRRGRRRRSAAGPIGGADGRPRGGGSPRRRGVPAGAAVGARAGRGRLGRRHPDAGPVRRHQARARRTCRRSSDLRTLEHVTGVSGEIDVVVHASERRHARDVGWMVQLRGHAAAPLRVLEARAARTRRCARRCRCLTCSARAARRERLVPGSLTAGLISSLLKAVPPYFSQAVITPDHREATLAFGIRLMPLARQQRVIDYMRSHLHPPSGVSARARRAAGARRAGRRVAVVVGAADC